MRIEAMLFELYPFILDQGGCDVIISTNSNNLAILEAEKKIDWSFLRSLDEKEISRRMKSDPDHEPNDEARKKTLLALKLRQKAFSLAAE
jgi:hypothetical protein